MSAVYAFVVAVWVYKDLKFKQVGKVLLDSASMSAMLLYIITNAILFSFLLTSEGIPNAMANWMNETGFGVITFARGQYHFDWCRHADGCLIDRLDYGTDFGDYWHALGC